MVHTLKIENLHVSVEGKPILRGVNLVIGHGETHALMDLTARERVRSAWRLWGIPIIRSPTVRSPWTIKISSRWKPMNAPVPASSWLFQRPIAIPGVKMADFLRHATTNVRRPDRKEGEDLIAMREFSKGAQGKDGAVKNGS